MNGNHKSLQFSKTVALFCVAIGLIVFNSCDSFDTEVGAPNVRLTTDELYVLSGSETIIDLTSLVSANFAGRLSVTGQPLKGTLTFIDGGLLRYTPDNTAKKSRDSFEFTAFTDGNTVLSKDTVFINIESDSTNMPCDIFPVPDYVTGLAESSETTINVLANDRLCGKSVRTELYSTATHPLPVHGTARINGTSIIYTPGPSFTGKDTLIYKVTDAQKPSSYGYGTVYINRDSVCNFQLADDAYLLNNNGQVDFYLDVFNNDMLCDSIDRYTVSISKAPSLGQLTFTGKAFRYHAAQQGNITDDFIYSVNSGTRQEFAHVSLRISSNVAQCTFLAVSDTVDISALSTSKVYIDVLKNDQVCDSLKRITIGLPPKYGTSTIDSATSKIIYNRVVLKSDSLRYRIFNGTVWREATLYIKQQD